MAEIENSTQSRLLRLSNLFGVRGLTDTRTNFVVNLNRMTETNNIVRCVCKSVTFANTAYNVISTGQRVNNKFQYTIPEVPATYVLEPPEGFYTTQQLIDYIQPDIEAKLQALDGAATATMTIDSTTKKIVLSVTGTNSVVLSGIAPLNILLGNTEDSGSINNSSYMFDSLQDLYGIRNVYVHSTTLADGNLVDGDVEQHAVIGEVPVNTPFGSMVYYESRDDELDSKNYDSVRNFDQIQIELKDLNDREIKLHGGGETIIVLKIYYV